MPLSVKDGMGAWIKDFQKSDAPQFKGKSDKERREMAMAAYLSAKRGDKNEGYVSDAQRRAVHATKADGGKGHPDNKKEEVKPPFTPDPKKPQAKNSDGTKTDPMSRARQLAKMARDRNMKKESVEENFNWKVSHAGKDVHVKAPHAGAAVKKAQKGFGNMDLTKAKISNLGKVGTPAKEETQIDELDSKTYRSYSDKAGKELMRTDISPDKRSRRALGRATADMKKYGDKRTLKQRIRQDMNKESTELDEAKYSWNDVNKALTKANYMRGNPAHIDRVAKHFDYKSGNDKKFTHADVKKNLSAAGIDAARHHNVIKHMKEGVELNEASAWANAGRALNDYARKSGGVDKADFEKASKHLYKISKAGLLQKGDHLAAFSKFFRDLDTDVRDRIVIILKQNNLMESVEEAGSPERYKMIKKAGDKYNKEKKKAERDARRAMSKDKDMMGEAKDFDQKFKDHLKFATSKSPAVKNYLAKRKADRDAMNKANDPNAAKKGYALTAVPPERAFTKARKKGMSASDASQAVVYGRPSRTNRKLPK